MKVQQYGNTLIEWEPVDCSPKVLALEPRRLINSTSGERVGDLGDLPPVTASDLFALIGDDAHEPGPKPAPYPKVAEAAPSAERSLLHRVLGEGPISQAAKRKPGR